MSAHWGKLESDILIGMSLLESSAHGLSPIRSSATAADPSALGKLHARDGHTGLSSFTSITHRVVLCYWKRFFLLLVSHHDPDIISLDPALSRLGGLYYRINRPLPLAFATTIVKIVQLESEYQ